MKARRPKIPYGQITRAAGAHADRVTGPGAAFGDYSKRWSLSFEAFKAGARWMAKGGKR